MEKKKFLQIFSKMGNLGNWKSILTLPFSKNPNVWFTKITQILLLTVWPLLNVLQLGLRTFSFCKIFVAKIIYRKFWIMKLHVISLKRYKMHLKTLISFPLLYLVELQACYNRWMSKSISHSRATSTIRYAAGAMTKFRLKICAKRPKK